MQVKLINTRPQVNLLLDYDEATRLACYLRDALDSSSVTDIDNVEDCKVAVNLLKCVSKILGAD